MPDKYNKFNSKSGFELNIDNILSKIRLDFDTNVLKPDDYILGINDTQTEFILVDPNYLNNTNNVENTFNLATLDRNMLGKVNHYTFEKLVDPSVVGCSNCDANTDVEETFVKTGEIPILNREIIAEFEVNPNAVHSIEVELVGHRTICDDKGNCYDSWSDSKFNTIPNGLSSNSDILNTMNESNRKAQFAFIDYNCCPCCDANEYYAQKLFNNEITGEQALIAIETICNKSNNHLSIDGVVVQSFSDYCINKKFEFLDETTSIKSMINQCELLRLTKNNYGSVLDNSLLNNTIGGGS